VSFERLSLLSLTSFTLVISRTTFSVVSFAWKSHKSEPRISHWITNLDHSVMANLSAGQIGIFHSAARFRSRSKGRRFLFRSRCLGCRQRWETASHMRTQARAVRSRILLCQVSSAFCLVWNCKGAYSSMFPTHVQLCSGIVDRSTAYFEILSTAHPGTRAH
jgi:hypothetical protein